MLKLLYLPRGGARLPEGPMFSHIFIGVADFERALHFYAPVMQALGQHQRFIERSRPWAGW